MTELEPTLATAISELRRARIAADKVLADFDAAVDDLRDRWNRELGDRADLDVWMFGEPDETAGQERLLGPADADALEQFRHAADQLRADVYARYTPVIEPARAELRRQLQAWIESTPSEVARDQWSTVLSAWRSAVGATVRQAAAALGVVPSTIVRHERGAKEPGGRVPSDAQLRKLVDALADAPVALGPWDNDDRTTRAMTKLFGIDRSEYADIVEAKMVNATTVADAIRDAIEGLSARQLSVLAAVMRHPTGLADLLAFAEHTATDPADAVRRRVLEGLADEQARAGRLTVASTALPATPNVQERP